MLDGADAALTGVLRINEQGAGIAVYNVVGSFEAPTLKLTGTPAGEVEGVELGQFAATGTMNAKGEIQGDWESTIGTAGTFVLFPHAGGEQPDEVQRTEQFHTARHNFGAIEVDREQVIEIAENIRREFPAVIVTVVAGTEQSLYLDDFKELHFAVDRAEIIKVFAQRPDGAGANQVVSIEFGPQINTAMTQGANEAWVLGQLETLKRDLKRYERTYVTNFKRWGIGINQIMLLAAIVFLPSLSDLSDRAILMGIVLSLIVGVNWLHSRYVPFADIQLREKKTGWLGKAWPRVASWGIGIVAAVLETLAAAYLLGALEIPAPPVQPPSVETTPSNLGQ
ncbi:hypothetical protein [Novosphingobium malaysiense]|uniref:Uncharacterized protein n=1 Tax=Novosphingobium malaysiense TaxID=1348853 RepID=A0A0B1ZRD4_9SPHN|nr:hypothetical protein [Novosphingobium malaysiense]KHK91757.1 hypothetical protein LK12_13390 [Novosphingobium malaysiense]